MTAQAQNDCSTDAGVRVSATTILGSMEESISALTPRLSMSLTNGFGLSRDTLGAARHDMSESASAMATTPRSASAAAAAVKEAAVVNVAGNSPTIPSIPLAQSFAAPTAFCGAEFPFSI